MGFMDEIKKLTQDDYDDYDDDPVDEQPAPAPRETRRDRSSYSSSSYSSSSSYAPRNTTADAPRSGAGKVVNLNSSTQLQVILVKPDRFDMVSEIADHLRDKQALVLNLESTNKDVARRLVDFLSGCAYALDGKIKKVAISTYLITPYNVDVVGDLVDELENSGMYF